jgi:hypothetical protein
MTKRHWRVGLLTEFMPTTPELLGLNINHGQEIRIRLRHFHARDAFMEFEEVLGTLLHELVHIVHGPHDAKFYALLDEIRTECEMDIASKNLPLRYLGKGRTLGQKPGGQVWSSSGRRLGGSGEWRSIEKVCRPAELAAQAALIRAKDAIWCGSSQTPQPKWICGACTIENVESAVACAVCATPRHSVLVPQEDWPCPVCTLVNPPSATQCAACALRIV